MFILVKIKHEKNDTNIDNNFIFVYLEFKLRTTNKNNRLMSIS